MKGTIIREFTDRERAVMEGFINRIPPFDRFLSRFFHLWAKYEYPEMHHGKALKGNTVEAVRFKPLEVIVEHDAIKTLVPKITHFMLDPKSILYEYVCLDRYYFDIGNNRVLRLECIPVYWPEFNKFPRTDLQVPHFIEFEGSTSPGNCFEVVRTFAVYPTRRYRVWVGVFLYGNELKPIKESNVVSEGRLECKCLAPVAIFKGSLDRLEETIKKEPVDVWN